MKANNPRLKVHFEVESYKPTDILLPIDLLEHGGIPCHSIVIDNPNTQVSVRRKGCSAIGRSITCSNITDFNVHYPYSRDVL